MGERPATSQEHSVRNESSSCGSSVKAADAEPLEGSPVVSNYLGSQTFDP
jgi:hypothetical protein